MTTLRTYPTPKIQIGARYEPRSFVRRETAGTYSAKMPESTQDGLLLQSALLNPATGRSSRRWAILASIVTIAVSVAIIAL